MAFKTQTRSPSSLMALAFFIQSFFFQRRSQISHPIIAFKQQTTARFMALVLSVQLFCRKSRSPSRSFMSFKQFSRFTNDAAGLEKILRFLQSLSQILAAYTSTVDNAVVWMHLRRQFALGRRYFRFFKFIVCFEKAYAAISFPLEFGGLLEVSKWSFMGCYLGLESVTILDALGVWPTPWAEVCMVEANRFWLYALVCSILKGLMEIYWQKRQVVRVKEKKITIQTGKKGAKRRLVSDLFDLLIPGHVTGWIPSSLGIMGWASMFSTFLSSKDVWDGLR